ncbi:DUF1816 domain-containing protein [Synechococcus sp. RSCCF101]|uniref:DUF1816 domain-containing protein n=1 Tax=Synechococcus sp. RSCCF101 TaxID=2511069 RepID=UPI001247AD80|nr:DUF1816 domain-containing protein [Synechococcus sp. RSCCF101]QEY31492.1 DUF1816 domain-containing protein [Synechococcus sp. RSCCF101]
MTALLIRPLRAIANGLGVAWWARVETRSPDVTYWFGPFLRRSGLEKALAGFLADLKEEAPGSMDHAILRTRRGEPLTIEAEPG